MAWEGGSLSETVLGGVLGGSKNIHVEKYTYIYV